MGTHIGWSMDIGHTYVNKEVCVMHACPRGHSHVNKEGCVMHACTQCRVLMHACRVGYVMHAE